LSQQDHIKKDKAIKQQRVYLTSLPTTRKIIITDGQNPSVMAKIRR